MTRIDALYTLRSAWYYLTYSRPSSFYDPGLSCIVQAEEAILREIRETANEYADKYQQLLPPAPTEKENKPLRTCNRHDDCDKAEQEVMVSRNIKRYQIHPSFHCHSEDCEECFGN